MIYCYKIQCLNYTILHYSLQNKYHCTSINAKSILLVLLAASDFECIASLHGDRQALAQKVGLPHIAVIPVIRRPSWATNALAYSPHAPKVSNARGTNTCVLERAAYFATSVASALAAAATALPADA